MQTVSMGYPQLPKASQSSDGGLASSLEGPFPAQGNDPFAGGEWSDRTELEDGSLCGGGQVKFAIGCEKELLGRCGGKVSVDCVRLPSPELFNLGCWDAGIDGRVCCSPTKGMS
jgi:hypothetical protein